MIKVGLIGLGHLGKLHLKNLVEICFENKNVEFVGVFDINTELNNSISNEYNLEINTDLDNLITKINTAIVVTPTSSHFEITKKLIANTINCFIEKPITDTVGKGLQLIELLKGKNIKVQVGHIERFNPAIISLEKYNLNPLFIESHRLSQFNPRGTDVSVIQDLMIHDIDIILNLVKSKVKKIDANGVALLTDNIDIANSRIKFENGCVANITASRISLKKMRKMRIFQKNAYISVDFLKNSSEVFSLASGSNAVDSEHTNVFDIGNNQKISYEIPTTNISNPLKYELKKFFECIENGTEPLVTLENGVQALEVANHIINEIQNSQEVLKI